MTEPRVRSTAAQLRADFDGGFARARGQQSPPQLDLLVVHVAAQVYAMRLSEVAALHADRKLTQAPSPRRELLGLVGLRGVVAPVYDLRVLLGYAPLTSPRWLAQLDGPAPLVIAFDHFERHLRVPASAWAAVGSGGQAAPRFVGGSVSTPAGALAVLDLGAIAQSFTHEKRAHRARERGEERS